MWLLTGYFSLSPSSHQSGTAKKVKCKTRGPLGLSSPEKSCGRPSASPMPLKVPGGPLCFLNQALASTCPAVPGRGALRPLPAQLVLPPDALGGRSTIPAHTRPGGGALAPAAPKGACPRVRGDGGPGPRE